MPALQRTIAPSVLPITLDEAKAQLRVTTTDQDALINRYIQAATDYIDGEWGFLGRCLVTQTWRLTLDGFPGVSGYTLNGYCWSGASAGQIKIPLPPLQSVSRVEYDDSAGNVQVVDPLNYFVDNANEPGWLMPETSWPSTINAINTVRIDFVAGYPADSSSPPDLRVNIPSNIIQAILIMISGWMENREGVVDSKMSELPFGAEKLLRRHKIQKSMA